MKYKSLVLGSALVAASSVHAADIDLALSGDTGAAELIVDSSFIGVGGADLSYGVFFNNDDDYMFDVGMMVEGRPAGEQPLTFGLGGKLMFLSIDEPDSSAQALALGGNMKYHIPSNTPMAIGASLYYAPSITAFNDADAVSDLRIRFEANVLPSATAFVGYRKLTADLGNKDYDLDDNVHVGIRFQF